MDVKTPTPQTTLLILLGASAWPLSSEFQSSQAFAKAAQGVKGYFLNPRLFGLPAKNLLDLFDADLSADNLDVAIGEFLQQRLKSMKAEGNSARDLLLYFIGHGGFVGRDSDFFLAIRRTREDNKRASGLQMLSLVDRLDEQANHLRRVIILDCCFAAAAYAAFQGGPAEVALAKTANMLKVNQKTEGFPTKGTTLLCSSSQRSPSRLLPDGSSTMFTRAFLDALTQGTSSQKARLNLRDVKDVAWDFLSSIPDAPRPVVDSPDQSEGDVAEIPFFPNPGFEKERIRLAEKEQRRRLEEQFHYAEETQRRQLEEAEKRQQLGRGGASVVPPEKETESFDLLSPQKAQDWGKIDTFLSKRRRVAWICFMLLSLTVGSVLPGFDRGFFSISNLGMSTPYLTIIGSVGATGVGLLFLFSKDKRPFLDILGGISLCGIAFTNFALSHYISNYRAYFNYDSYFNYHYASFYIFAFFIFFVLFSLWLFVGSRFVLRSANIVGGLLLGVLLIIGGIILLYPQPEGFFTLSLLTVLPALTCETCGAIAIIVALRQRTYIKRNI